MEKEKGPEDFLPQCMEQKLVLLTKISDVTKQIEVQSRQEEINLGDLADRRQVFIDRLKKCQNMIDAACRQLPPEQQERRKKILSGRFPEEECTPEEARLLKIGAKCGVVLQETLAMDREAHDRLQKECDRLQKLLHSSRRPAAQKYPVNG